MLPLQRFIIVDIFEVSEENADPKNIGEKIKLSQLNHVEYIFKNRYFFKNMLMLLVSACRERNSSSKISRQPFSVQALAHHEEKKNFYFLFRNELF